MQMPRAARRKKRGRNQFRSFLVHELNRRGANLPPAPDYRELAAAVDRYLKPVKQ